MVAQEWLGNLQQKLEFPKSNIWVAPGNHDVDRNIVRASKILPGLKNDVLNCESSEEASKRLGDFLREAESLFTKPIAAYNDFAAPYMCGVGDGRPFAWTDNSSLTLNDGSNLYLHGLNSAVLSGPDDGPGRLMLGEFQVPSRVAGAVQLSLCHHPLDWLKDGDTIGPRLDRVAAIQLYGHVHEHQVDHDERRRVG